MIAKVRTLVIAGLVAVVGGACADPASPDTGTIELRNRTDASLLVIAVEYELSHLMDPNPRFTIGTDDPRVIEPGETRAVSFEAVEGPYRAGDTLYALIYHVQGGEAVLSNSATVTYAELFMNGMVLELEL